MNKKECKRSLIDCRYGLGIKLGQARLEKEMSLPDAVVLSHLTLSNLQLTELGCSDSLPKIVYTAAIYDKRVKIELY